jgi:hypothetical protein
LITVTCAFASMMILTPGLLAQAAAASALDLNGPAGGHDTADW